MVNRKIVSTNAITRENDDGGVDIILFALADDGTLWRRNAKSGADWKLVKNVPKTPVATTEASYKRV